MTSQAKPPASEASNAPREGGESYTKVEFYKALSGDVSISPQMIVTLFAPKATHVEAFAFVRFCIASRLNPMAHEVYLIKYDERSPAAIVIGKDAFLKRAEAHPQYWGFEAGIVVERNGERLDLPGALGERNDTLVGGWCRVYRRDRRLPIEARLSRVEYDRQRSLWLTHPATMMRKVAIVQAHREAFPDVYGQWQNLERTEYETPLRVVEEGPEGEAVIDGQTVKVGKEDVA